MKKLVQSILQKLLGFDRYLFYFSRFKIKTLKKDSREGDFFHFLGMLGEDSNVLDVGANIGIMTYWLSKRCKKGQVICFEPVVENFKVLKKVVSFYGLQNVRLLEMALGEENGHITMVMPEVSSVRMQGLSHVKHESITEFNDGKEYRVEQRRLDDVEEIRDFRISGIKIDVENFEQFVFRGARNLIERDLPIVYCELWANDNRSECFKIFTALNYEIKVLSAGQLVRFEEGKHSQQNFFFVPINMAGL